MAANLFYWPELTPNFSWVIGKPPDSNRFDGFSCERFSARQTAETALSFPGIARTRLNPGVNERISGILIFPLWKIIVAIEAKAS